MQRDPLTPYIFQQFAAQGQSFFQASMDHGAYVGDGLQPNVEEPIIRSSLMTVVGGTIPSTDASTRYGSETTWNNPNNKIESPFNAASGGGFCLGYGVVAQDQTASRLIGPADRSGKRRQRRCAQRGPMDW